MMNQLKTLNIRLKFDDWRFLKEYAFNKGSSINAILNRHVKNLRDKNEKKDEKSVEEN